MKTIYSIIAFTATFCLISSFNSKQKKPKLAKFFIENYAFIPSGNVVLDSKEIIVDSFYLFKTELSNFQYLEFLSDLKRSGKLEEYKKYYPDTSNWRVFPNSKFADYYFTHPAYRDFPVVNVTQASAEAYCLWLGQKLGEGQPGFEFEARLPTRAEWLRAAKSESKYAYSWNTNQLTNEKGQILANFTRIGLERLSKNPETGNLEIKGSPILPEANSSFDILAPVKSYWAGNFGIYNMNGNAAEMTLDGFVCGGSWRQFGYDVRNDSFSNYEKSDIHIGFRPLVHVKRKG